MLPVLEGSVLDAARVLNYALENGLIDRYFEFVDGTAGSDSTLTLLPGMGVNNDQEFEVPAYADLRLLSDLGLIELEETLTGRGNRKWQVLIRPNLQTALSESRDDEAQVRGKVFLSHSHQDRRFVNQIVSGLNSEYEIWYDKNIPGGADWWEDILEHIASCDVFFYLLSNDSIDSIYCRAEFAEALRLGKSIATIACRPIRNTPRTIAGRRQVTNIPDDWEIERMEQEILLILDAAQQRGSGDFEQALWPQKALEPDSNAYVLTFQVAANTDPVQSAAELNTGVLIIPGDKISISVTGRIVYDEIGTWADASGRIQGAGEWEHPEAYKTHEGDGLIGALFGWIGDYQPRSAFRVGANFEWKVPEHSLDGFLFLAVNDAKGSYGDNSGSFTVELKVFRNS